MSYKNIYYSTFKDVDDNTIDIEIYKKDSTLTESELQCVADSVSINYEGTTDVFKPIKCSDCQINIVTKTVLNELYSALGNNIYCIIKRNNHIFWYGFTVPCLYTTDFNDEFNSLSLQFNDILSTLASYQYEYVSDATNNITSTYQIIKHIIKRIDEDKIIKNVYVMSNKTIEGKNDLLNSIYLNERNFFDEKGESENCKDVLEYISQYLNTTLYYQDEALYFVDYQALNRYDKYIQYNLENDTITKDIVLSDKVSNVNSIIYEANATIELNELYNQITVIANTNKYDDLIDSPTDEGDLTNQNTDENKYYETKKTINNEEYTYLNAFFKSKGNYNYLVPFSVNYDTKERFNINEVTIDNFDSVYAGTLWQKAIKYKSSEEPSSLNWDTYLSFIHSYNGSKPYGLIDDCFLSYNQDVAKFNVIEGGYIILNMNYRFSFWRNPLDEFQYGGNYQYDYNTLIPCRLRIANQYFDGEQFRDYSTIERREQNGYYNDVRITDSYSGIHRIYRIYDEYGDRYYVLEDEYNAYQGSKDSSETTDPNLCYWYVKGQTAEGYNIQCYVDEEYYHESRLKDKFYLVTKNKDNDEIYADKQLTNTVSWRMNITDATDGVAIKLPDTPLTGKILLELYRPNDLGTYVDAKLTSEHAGIRYLYAMHISDISIKYANVNEKGIFETESDDNDIKYTNIIDDKIVNEFEDIEFRINTYSTKQNSYSYAMLKDNNTFKFAENFKDSVTSDEDIAECLCVKKYANYYSKPRFIFGNSLKNDDIKLYSLFNNRNIGKTLSIASIEYHLDTNSTNATLIEQPY